MINSKISSLDSAHQQTVINNIARSTVYPNIRAKGDFLYDDVLWPVMPEECQQDVKIMNSLFKAVDRTYASCSRFLAIRYDFHLPQYTADNRVITRFHQLLIPALRKEYPKSFARVFWVREQNRAPAQHYHYLLKVDGNYVRHPLKINKLVESCWKIATGGTVWFPKHGYYLIRKNDTEAMAALLLRISYFAKRHSKEGIAKGIARSGTRHYPFLKKTKHTKTVQLRTQIADFDRAQAHCPLPGKLDSLFTPVEHSAGKPTALTLSDSQQLDKAALLPMKALRRALQRFSTLRGRLPDGNSVVAGTKLSLHWHRHFERYYRYYWPCNISVSQYCRWYYLNPSTAIRYLCNYPANLVNPWLLAFWL
ncbi:YagK/YfjJ domain-containing protein [Mixta calida]|uniref:YagK/YfjJ domain-containing protein n=1 Tax=Mixta calida TaxID=665913 RepID=UPI003CFAD94A